MSRKAFPLFLFLLLSAAVPLRAGDKVDPSRQSLVDVTRRLDSIDQKLSNSDVSSRLAGIEEAVNDQKHSSFISTILPSIIAAFAALAGIWVGGLGQRRLAEKQAKLQIGNAVVEWQLKQLSLLYGPVRALLGQSFGLYRQMNNLLERADATRFRFIKVENAQGQNAEHDEEFQIRTATGWERFRTVMHIEQVYGRDYGVETYFDEIVLIGARIVKIIEKNAGYARPEEEQLMDVFAKYLAHFAVLNHLHGLARAKSESLRTQSSGTPSAGEVLQQLNVDVSAVFPRELHNLISTGFAGITKDIEQWREKALA